MFIVDNSMLVFPSTVDFGISSRSRPSAPPILGVEFLPCVSKDNGLYTLSWDTAAIAVTFNLTRSRTGQGMSSTPTASEAASTPP